MEKKHTIMKRIPNILTVIRLLLVPVFIYFFQNPGLVLPARYFALVIFVTACGTDLLDGRIARKYNAVSNFGKLVDPLADKLLTLSALVCFYLSGEINWVFVGLILLKELLMVVGSYVMLRYHIVVYSDIFGKTAAFTMAVAVIMTFIPGIHPWNIVVLGLSLVQTFIALFHYARSAVRQIRERKAAEAQKD